MASGDSTDKNAPGVLHTNFASRHSRCWCAGCADGIADFWPAIVLAREDPMGAGQAGGAEVGADNERLRSKRDDGRFKQWLDRLQCRDSN